MKIQLHFIEWKSKFLSLLCMLFYFGINISAYDFESDGIYYKVESDNTASVSWGNYEGEIIIPETVTYNDLEYTIIAIEMGAFYNCSSLISIELPNSLTKIGDYAFYGCESIVSIDLPDSMTSIGDNAFAICSSLVSIDLPDSINYVGYNAFFECTSLVSIELSNSLDSINWGMFYGCSSLKNIDFPESLTSIEGQAFEGCSSLIFIELPNSLTSIGENAFSNCYSLVSIDLSNSLTSIGNMAFYGCDSLVSIDLPDSLIYIGDGSLGNCKSLTTINVSQENQYFASLNGILFNKDITTLIQYPAGLNITEYSIPDSINSIRSYAFWGCRLLDTIGFPNSLNSIGLGAFKDCNSLVYLDLPNLITLIDSFTFDGCSSLVSIDLPESLTSIGLWAFRNCSSLVSIDFPDSLNSILTRAFDGCNSLKEVLCKCTIVPRIGGQNFLDIPEDAILYVYESVLEDYMNSDWAQYFSEILPIQENVEVTAVEISPEGNRELKEGESMAFAANVIPEDATDKTVIWSTDNDEVIGIEVSEENPNEVIVTALAVGEAVLTAIAADGSGVSAQVYITVVEPQAPFVYVTSIEISPSGNQKLVEGQTMDFIATVYPKNATDSSVMWTTDSPEVISLGDYNIDLGEVTVTALATGVAVLQATSLDGSGAYATVTITVSKDEVTGIAGVQADSDGFYNVYRLSGELILSTKDASRLQNLEKGMYIVNGKTIMK